MGGRCRQDVARRSPADAPERLLSDILVAWSVTQKFLPPWASQMGRGVADPGSRTTAAVAGECPPRHTDRHAARRHHVVECRSAREQDRDRGTRDRVQRALRDGVRFKLATDSISSATLHERCWARS